MLARCWPWQAMCCYTTCVTFQEIRSGFIAIHPECASHKEGNLPLPPLRSLLSWWGNQLLLHCLDLACLVLPHKVRHLIQLRQAFTSRTAQCFRDFAVPMFTRATLTPNRIFAGLIASTMVFCWYCTLPLTNWLYLLLPLLLLSVIENSMDLTTTVYRFVCHVFANYSTVSFTFLLQPFLALIGTSG